MKIFNTQSEIMKLNKDALQEVIATFTPEEKKEFKEYLMSKNILNVAENTRFLHMKNFIRFKQFPPKEKKPPVNLLDIVSKIIDEV